MARLKPKESVIKRLFALSGNQCAYPECEEHIVDELGTVIGEICHIEAAEIGGERYNDDSNDEHRRSFENLILMCSNHHKKTNNIQAYKTPSLIQYKSEHEKRFINNAYQVSDRAVNEAIQNFMEQNNDNTGSGNQFNNQANKQKIKNQIGVQNVYNNGDKVKSPKIEGSRSVNQKFKSIINKFKQDATAPTT